MIKYKAFLRWWLFFVSILVGTVILQSVNGFNYIFSKDATKLTVVITVGFYLVSAWCGLKTWRLDRSSAKGNVMTDEDYRELSRMEDIGWFSSDVCTNIGLLGTIMGFLMMLQDFNNLDVTNPASVQSLLVQLGSSMGVALWTTCVGLVASQLLKIQYMNYGLELEKLKPNTLKLGE